MELGSGAVALHSMSCLLISGPRLLVRMGFRIS
jgi:hypothetical protein